MWAANGRQESEWQRTAQITWAILEPKRNRKKRKTPYTPDDFNPYRKSSPKKKNEALPRIGARELAKLLGAKKGKQS